MFVLVKENYFGLQALRMRETEISVLMVRLAADLQGHA
jgi:hypothetical protein